MHMANQEVLITIIIYNFLLIVIGFWAKNRTSNQDDFYLGGRGLGPWVTALSALSFAKSVSLYAQPLEQSNSVDMRMSLFICLVITD